MDGDHKRWIAGALLGLATLIPSASVCAQLPTEAEAEAEARLAAERDARTREQMRIWLDRALDGNLEAEDWAEFLGVDDDRVGERGARFLLATVEPFPLEILGQLNPRARRRLLIGLSERPRPSLDPWLVRQSERSDLDPIDRGLLVAARDPERWTIRDMRSLLDLVDRTETLSRDREQRILQREWRLAVQAALRRTPPRLCDRLVGEIHRRLLLEPTAFARYRTVLREVSGNGLRVIAAAGQTLESGVAEEILDFLSAKEPEFAADLALRRFRDGDRSETVLRLLPTQELDDVERDRMRRRIGAKGDDAFDFKCSRAALASLVRGGFVDLELLDLVGSSAFGSRSLLRRAIRSKQLSVEDLAQVYGAVKSSERQAILAELIEREDGFPVIVDLVKQGDSAAIAWFVEKAPVDWVTATWPRFEGPVRDRWVTTLAKRRDELAVRLIAKETGDTTNLRAARLRLGQRAEWLLLLEDPNRLPTRWLERLRKDLVRLAAEEDVERLGQLIADQELDDSRRAFFCALLQRRPSLGLDKELSELAETAESELVRDAARSAAVARESVRSRLIEELRPKVQGIVDDDTWGYAVQLIDACPRPLSEREARFAAELLLGSSPGDTVEGGSDAPVIAVFRLLLGNGADKQSDTAFLAAAQGVVTHLLEQGEESDLSAHLEQCFSGIFLLACRDPDAREVLVSDLAELLGTRADLDGALAASIEMVRAEELERAQEYEAAAEAWDRAWALLHRVARWNDLVLRAALPPARQRDVDSRPYLDTAYRAARPWICRARSAMSRGENDRARSLLSSAEELAAGDGSTLQEVRELRQTLR